MNPSLSKNIGLAALALLLSASSGLPPALRAQTASDDSARNKAHKLTADDQANAKADRDTTAKIRRAIIADKSLSMYAHNVKIITINGAVTLKGPVKSEEERSKVVSDAGTVIATDAITNSLTVKQ